MNEMQIDVMTVIQELGAKIANLEVEKAMLSAQIRTLQTELDKTEAGQEEEK